MPQMSRRDVIKIIGGAAAMVATSPALFAKEVDGVVELIAAPVSHKLHHAEDALASDLWGYNGEISGPVIKLRQGRPATIRFTNLLPEPTSVHWHGLRIENSMDGVSGLTQPAVLPGESFVYEFTPPDTGTYWYHAHNNSWSQVARGLYGGLIVEPASGPALPEDQDHILVIDDWRLNANGQLDKSSLGAQMDWSHGGRLGNWLTVNGKSAPKIMLQSGAANLLRLVNASNSRVLELDPSKFGGKIVAFDGQSVPEEPIELHYRPLLLGPAQRVDLLVYPQNPFALEEVSGQAFPFCFFELASGATKTVGYTHPRPNDLPFPSSTDRLEFSIRMTGGAMGTLDDIYYQGEKLDMAGFQRTQQFWAFNGVANLMEQPILAVKQGQTISLQIENSTAFMHAMHLHGHHFLIEDRDGDGVEHDNLWRDTFLIAPRQTTRVSFVADNLGKWLFHCHMLEHAASGMNAWIEVNG